MLHARDCGKVVDRSAIRIRINTPLYAAGLDITWGTESEERLDDAKHFMPPTF
jgi:hypothetical protein